MEKSTKRGTRTIWAIVFLVGGYILCQAIADVGATKMIDLAGIIMPAGSMIFAVTFTLRDLVHKRLGKEWAKAAIVAAAAFNVLQAGYLALMARIPAASFFANGEAWNVIFSIVPSITLGSIVSELVSELIDTEVYEFCRLKFPCAPQWLRVLASNAVSLPIDSFVFSVLGFMLFPLVFGGEPLAFVDAMATSVGQIYWKAFVTVVSMPGIYLVKDKPLAWYLGE